MRHLLRTSPSFRHLLSSTISAPQMMSTSSKHRVPSLFACYMIFKPLEKMMSTRYEPPVTHGISRASKADMPSTTWAHVLRHILHSARALRRQSNLPAGQLSTCLISTVTISLTLGTLYEMGLSNRERSTSILHAEQLTWSPAPRRPQQLQRPVLERLPPYPANKGSPRASSRLLQACIAKLNGCRRDEVSTSQQLTRSCNRTSLPLVYITLS